LLQFGVLSGRKRSSLLSRRSTCHRGNLLPIFPSITIRYPTSGILSISEDCFWGAAMTSTEFGRSLLQSVPRENSLCHLITDVIRQVWER
jgi:hypothetical protein